MIRIFLWVFVTLSLVFGIRLHADELPAPLSAYGVSPAGPHHLSTGFGHALSLPLSLSNSSVNQADWKTVFQSSAPPSLELVHANLRGRMGAIHSLIPDREQLPATGYLQSMGGAMYGYNSGNIHKIGFSLTIFYSAGEIRTSTAYGNTAKYFTNNEEGLFVFAGELKDSDSFQLSGYLGNSGLGRSGVLDKFLIAANGVTYQAYAYRIHGGTIPSVNHLVLTPYKPTLTSSHSTSPYDEMLEIRGLGSSATVYHLLFSKPNGADAGAEVLKKLAAEVLEVNQGDNGWAKATPRSGQVAGGQTGPLAVTMDPTGLAPGTYTTKFAVVPREMGYQDIPLARFDELKLTVRPPAFTVPVPAEVVSVKGFSPEPIEIELQPSVAGTLLSGLEVSSSEPWAIPSLIQGTNRIRVSFDSAELAVSSYQAVLEVKNAETKQLIPLKLIVEGQRIVKFLADPMRPRVYALQWQSYTGKGAVLVIDSASRKIIRHIPMGRKSIDCDIADDGRTLLVLCQHDKSIIELDLNSFEIKRTHVLTAFGDTGNVTIESDSHVRAGKGDILYYSDAAQPPQLRVYNRATGQVLQGVGADGGTVSLYGYNGVGGLVLSPDGSHLYVYRQYGWEPMTHAPDSVYVGKFAVNVDGKLTWLAKSRERNTEGFNRYPYNSPMSISSDGRRLFVKNRVFNTSDLTELNPIFPAAVDAITPTGNLVLSKSTIHSSNGEALIQVPGNVTQAAMLPDHSAMVYYDYYYPDANISGIRWFDLPQSNPEDVPGDGETTVLPALLKWQAVAGAFRYQVYFGTDRAEVEAATPDSRLYLGEVNGTSFPITPPEEGVEYFWRIVPIGYKGTEIGSGIVRSFHVSDWSLSRSSIEVHTVQGVAGHIEKLTVRSATESSWTVETDEPWLHVNADPVGASSEITVTVDSKDLIAGSYQGHVRILSAGRTLKVPVRVIVHAKNYVLAQADPVLPYIYAVSQESLTAAGPSMLLRINSRTAEIEDAVPCGRSVTDMAVHEPENRIYVTDWEGGLLRTFDRASLKESRIHAFAPPSGEGPDSGEVFQVATGAKGRVIISTANGYQRTHLINTDTGAKMASVGTDPGKGIFDARGEFFYKVEYDSYSFGVTKYDMRAGVFTYLQAVSGSRYDAGNQLITRSGDGSRFYWKGGTLLPDMTSGYGINGVEMPSMTYRGEVTFSSKTAYVAAPYGGYNSHVLPVDTKVQAVSPDQKNLFLFKGGDITLFDISSIAEVPSPDPTPSPADGATVGGISPRLGWSGDPLAVSYEIYFGNSAESVEAAGKNSPEYLGSTALEVWDGMLPPLEYGSTYWWRIDVVGHNGVIRSAVHHFRVSSVEPSPVAFELETPDRSPLATQSIVLENKGTNPTSLPWQASTSASWIQLKSTSGSTPAVVEFDIDNKRLYHGWNENLITIETDGGKIEIPVRINVLPLKVTKLLADPDGTVAYGIHENAVAGGNCYLLEIDVVTGSVLRTLNIGPKTGDFTVDFAGGRLFFGKKDVEEIGIVGLDQWSVLPSMPLQGIAGLLAHTSRGRLVVGPVGFSGYLRIYEASSGDLLSSEYFNSTSSMQVSPDGNSLFTSSYGIEKYDISRDTATRVGRVDVDSSSAGVFMRSDGDRVFVDSRVFDADLNLLGFTSGIVRSADRAGNFAIGDKVWWLDGGAEVSSVSGGKVVTLGGGDRYLLVFGGGYFYSSDLSNHLPGSWPRPGQSLDASPVRLSWKPVTDAVSYRVFIAADATALQTMTQPVATVSTTYYDLPAPLAAGAKYAWRVDAVKGSGQVIKGTALLFTVRLPMGGVIPTTVNPTELYVGGQQVDIWEDMLLVAGDRHARVYQFDATTGGVSSMRNVAPLTAESYYGNSFSLDGSKAFVGAASVRVDGVEGAGMVQILKPDTEGIWERSQTLAEPVTPRSGGFGDRVAVGGNLMLTRVRPSYTEKGKVQAYVTEPEARFVQEFSANDGVVDDQFGAAMVIQGNEAIISAPGQGPWSSTQPYRLPCLYAFTRSTATGLWTQSQKIVIPGAISNSPYSAGNMLTAFGNTFVINDYARSQLMVFKKNTENGQWAHASNIALASFGGQIVSSISLASENLLLVGDINVGRGVWGQGGVHCLRYQGSAWVAGPLIAPVNAEYSSFGQSIATEGGWLLAGGEGHPQAWLFHIDSQANRRPRFVRNVPTQVRWDQAISLSIRAEDADGNDGLAFSLLQGPAWLGLTDHGGGVATLSGTPSGNPGDVSMVQLRVTDVTGAETYHAYDLRLVGDADRPVVTRQPAGGDFPIGRGFGLVAEASGTGALSWQWSRDGVAIPGATRSSLHFREAEIEDAGAYQVTVSNTAGMVHSETVQVTISGGVRHAGDWMTMGGDSSRSGYYPAELGTHKFGHAWSRQMSTTGALHRSVTGGKNVYVIPKSTMSYAGPRPVAFDIRTGAERWSLDFAASYEMNPPTYYRGSFYYRRTSASLSAIDGQSGELAWSASLPYYYGGVGAPVIDPVGIWMNTSSSIGRGMSVFDFSGGARQIYSGRNNGDVVTTISEGRVFTRFDSQQLLRHSPKSGTIIWSVLLQSSRDTAAPERMIAASGDHLAVVTDTGVVCIDAEWGSILWSSPGNYSGTPAIADGVVYSIQDNAIVTHSLTDGVVGRVLTFPEKIISEQPLLLKDRLFAASATKTYVVNLASSAIEQTLDGGGLLSFADGYLFVSRADGKLDVWQANVPPVLAGNSPHRLPVGAASATQQISMAPLLLDENAGESFDWSLGAISDPGIFSSLSINPTDGTITVVYHGSYYGRSTVEVIVSDRGGNQTIHRVEFSVPPASPSLAGVELVEYDPLNGIYRQTVSFRNDTGVPLSGVDLMISGLPSGVALYNGSLITVDGGKVTILRPLEVGEAVTAVIQYRAPVGMQFTPQLSILSLLPDSIEEAAMARPFEIRGIECPDGGAVTLRFHTQPGNWYEVMYTEDMVEWKACPLLIHAAGTLIEWRDNEGPSTRMDHSTEMRRFYKIRRVER